MHANNSLPDPKWLCDLEWLSRICCNCFNIMCTEGVRALIRREAVRKHIFGELSIKAVCIGACIRISTLLQVRLVSYSMKCEIIVMAIFLVICSYRSVYTVSPLYAPFMPLLHCRLPFRSCTAVQLHCTCPLHAHCPCIHYFGFMLVEDLH